MYGLASGDEQLESLARAQATRITETRDGAAVYVLHREIGPAAVGYAGVEHFGDARVIQDGQHLALHLEPHQHFTAVHSSPDDFQRNTSLHGLALLGHPDSAESAFADRLDKPEPARRFFRVF